MYSNSMHDQQHDAQTIVTDEGAVRDLYERAPYPGLGAGLKDMQVYLNPIIDALARRSRVRFLDAGCGTGHYLVGVAKHHPDWDCYGLDLSQASLEVAEKLADLHGAQVTLGRGSYLEPLPFRGQFDVVAALGTIHHAADPVAGLRILRGALRDDGFLLLHLYGLRIDREKFDLKEMLSIFEPDLSRVDRRFALYDALMRHRRRRWVQTLLQMRLVDFIVAAKRGLRDLLRRSRGVVWSPPYTERFREPTAPWIDHFCHPCERAYEVSEIVDLVSQSGFQIVHMLGQGREYLQLIPPEWRASYEGLPQNAKWRLSELLAFGGGSFQLVLRKASEQILS
jgi:SAM-dependent methyltransferase